MNPDIKKLWIEALLSGEYEQGVGKLKSEDGHYCCLGVLCNLAVRAGVNINVRLDEDLQCYPLR